MIVDDERRKRQRAYEIAKQNSKDRGVELTPETEELSKRFINGEISEYAPQFLIYQPRKITRFRPSSLARYNRRSATRTNSSTLISPSPTN